ncbi:nuclear transport factor 2 family protein [Jannaschia seohaensis]|uniref:SnoaL-like domain-containing protein n=1 Tax=Jannaschia seohaensis TaxID=475081 RepID=A0A2Y9AY44_9RHOB|nr:nuclear transport factor 2 family protein [Jannaschia seohaensis]PWJ16206.1 SnoaL-like protein [Jannaschia seohaensis]SSA49234.1 SnoaL-like domain-containing protein [Jannaschia seohaensis]
MTDTKSQSEAERVVRTFLAALEARDLDTARALTGPGFEMRFPGTGAMTDFAELMDWAAGRYRRVGKTIDAVESFADEAKSVVYTRGTLAGDWPDGTPFDGIRFIDRFEIVDGRITDQQVWNDLAEMRAARPAEVQA